jgi:hypothetical protein
MRSYPKFTIKIYRNLLRAKRDQSEDLKNVYKAYFKLYFIQGFGWGKLSEKDYLGDPGVDGRIILRWILRKWDVGVWTGSSWKRNGTGAGHL